MKVVNGLVERPGSTYWRVRHPPFLLERIMKELSIFCDESGDFGEYSHLSPYYIISMVIHDQSADITKGFPCQQIGWISPVPTEQFNAKEDELYVHRRSLVFEQNAQSVKGGNFLQFFKSCPLNCVIQVKLPSA